MKSTRRNPPPPLSPSKVRRRSQRAVRPPPPRLGWPAVSLATAAAVAPPLALSSSPSSFASAPASVPLSSSAALSATTVAELGSKRSRRVTFPVGGSSRNNSRSSGSAAMGADDDHPLLWWDAHAPTSVEGVCVAPKKMKEIQDWLKGGASQSSSLLILCGSPGVGKSTAIRVLARHLGIGLREWTEALSSSYSSSSLYSPHVLAHSTPLDSFESFLQQARIGYSSVVAVVGARRREQHEDGRHPRNGRKRPKESGLASSTVRIPSSHSPRRSLILLDELPNLHGAEMEDRFRNLFTTHVVESSTGRSPGRVRTVLIWSHVTEGKHHKDDLERLVDSHVLYDQRYCKMMQIHPPTKARFGKIVDSVAEAHGIRSVDSMSLYDRSGGDIRFAITALQLENGRAPSNSDRSPSDPAVHSELVHRRDERLHPMHVLGKLLYAKRLGDSGSTKTAQQPPPDSMSSDPSQGMMIPSRWWRDGRGRLEFDPEGVLDRCEMELPAALQFLAYHAVDFTTEIDELSDVLGCYSDAAWLLADCSRGAAPSNLARFGEARAAASSVAGRAIATFNLHPAPFKFRQLSKPPSFDALRKRLENQAYLRHVLSRSSSSSIHGVDQYATDSLAFVRRIAPESSPQLESFLTPSRAHAALPFLPNGNDELSSSMAPSILEDDDISEFSDGDNEDEEEEAMAAFRKRSRSARLSLLIAPTGSAFTQPTAAISTSPATLVDSPLR